MNQIKRGCGVLVAAIAIVALGGSIATPPLPAAAAPHRAAVAPTTIELSSPVTHVRTPSGERLHLRLSLTKASTTNSTASTGRYDTALDIRLSTPSGAESHAWAVSLPASALTKTPSGYRLSTGRAMGKYATVNLQFTNVGQVARQRCPLNHAPGHVTTQRGTLKGTFFLDTHSKGKRSWGRVGGFQKRFSFPSYAKVVKAYGNATPDCSAGTQFTPCFTGVNWSTVTTRLSADSLDGGYRVDRNGRNRGIRPWFAPGQPALVKGEPVRLGDP